MAQRDILSEFWSPVCAIGGHGVGRLNAQICVSVFGASVVPAQPRLLVNLWKDNYTHDLVMASGTLAVTVLSEQQAGLVERLGMASGRERDKLSGLDVITTPQGDPTFPGGASTINCAVIEAFDLGDATSFLLGVRSRQRTPDTTVLTRERMHELLGPGFGARWAEMAAARQPAYARQMLWRGGV